MLSLFSLQAARDYGVDKREGGDISLLNHHTNSKEEPNYNMILLNSIVHNDRPSPHRVRSHQRTTNHHVNNHHLEQQQVEVDYTDSNSILCDLLSHVKQINEELHGRHTNQDADEVYKTEWRMVALVLDRLLLIIFFIMTVFTCVVIFVNVPH